MHMLGFKVGLLEKLILLNFKLYANNILYLIMMEMEIMLLIIL
jgi:hypothetical protein